MVSSVLHIMSQVEHTKKCNSIDSESKSVKRNADHRNRGWSSVAVDILQFSPAPHVTISYLYVYAHEVVKGYPSTQELRLFP